MQDDSLIASYVDQDIMSPMHNDKFYFLHSDQSLVNLWTHCERTTRSSFWNVSRFMGNSKSI